MDGLLTSNLHALFLLLLLLHLLVLLLSRIVV